MKIIRALLISFLQYTMPFWHDKELKNTFNRRVFRTGSESVVSGLEYVSEAP